MGGVFRDEGVGLRMALEHEVGEMRRLLAEVRAKVGPGPRALARLERRVLRPAGEGAGGDELAWRVDWARAVNAWLASADAEAALRSADTPLPAALRVGRWPAIERVNERWPGLLTFKGWDATEALLDEISDGLDDVAFSAWDGLEEGVYVNYAEARGAYFVVACDAGHTAVVASLSAKRAPESYPGRLSLEAMTFRAALSEVLWRTDVRLGDDEFDAAFLITGDITWASVALNAPVREALLRFDPEVRVRLFTGDGVGAIAWEGGPARAPLRAACAVLTELAGIVAQR